MPTVDEKCKADFILAQLWNIGQRVKLCQISRKRFGFSEMFSTFWIGLIWTLTLADQNIDL